MTFPWENKCVVCLVEPVMVQGVQCAGCAEAWAKGSRSGMDVLTATERATLDYERGLRFRAEEAE